MKHAFLIFFFILLHISTFGNSLYPLLPYPQKIIYTNKRKHSVNHVFSSSTSIINFTSKKPSYDDTRRSGRDNELLQRAQNDL